MADLLELRGTNVLLRRPAAADVSERLALGRQREIIEAYGGTFDPAAPYTHADAQGAIDFIRAHDHAWVIDVGRYVGHLRFHSFVPQDRRASMAIGIDDPTCLGKGLGSEAIGLALDYIFSTGLHRVAIRVLATNDRAISCYRKCGFVEEGREREAALVTGKYVDDVIMGKLVTDPPLRPSTTCPGVGTPSPASLRTAGSA